MSLLDGYEEQKQQNNQRVSLLDGYDKSNEIISQGENNPEPTKTIEGKVEKNYRNYNTRFPDRNGNFFSNAGADISDTVKGLAQMVGGVKNFVFDRPLMNVVLGDKDKSIKDRLFTGEGIQDIQNIWKNAPETLNNLKEGLKENYGQGGIDMISKEGGLKVDVPGLVQSLYAHPLNLLDLVGVGEVGKINKIAKATKGGEVSKFAKNVGNNSLSPKYSENLVYNAAQRLAETKPVQNIVNAIDNSPVRGATDVVADFLNINPDSRLMGTRGAEVRQAKLIEQANQTKNIAERNAAIAENVKNLSGLSESEAKELIKSIESGKTLFVPETREIIEQKIRDYNFNNIKNNISVRGDEFGKNLSLQEIQDKAENYFRNNIQGKTINNKELGNITANAKSRRKYASGAGSNLKYKIAPKLNDVIESAKYIGTELPLENKNNNFIRVHKLGNRVNIGNETVDFLINVGEDTKGNLFYNIDDIVERPLSAKNSSAPNGLDNIITNATEISTPRMREVKNLLREKVNANAEAYKSMGKLTDETVEQLPINTYASIKYNKPISELSDIEKLDALKDIEKMPAEQKPFYVPMMFEDNLRSGDFFANTTKNYKPNELRTRSVGMGLEESSRGGKRIYNPVELANRLDAHRIKMVNTKNMIDEIVENFAKPLDLSKDKVLEGYVPFNPDAFMKFYKKSIDLNEITLRKLDELDNIDTALKSSITEAIKELPEDIVEMMGAFKNNKIYQIPKDVANTLMSGKNRKGIWEAMFDMGTAGFKRKVLGLSPKWFINNRIGNGIMAGLKGVNLDNYIKALNIPDNLLPESLRTKSMYEAEKTIIGRTGGGNNGFFGNSMRLLGGEFIDTRDLKGLQKAEVTAANALGVPGKIINKITDAMFAFNQKFEDWERRAAYLHSVDTVGKKMLKTAGQNIVKQDELLKATLKDENVLNEVLKNVDNTLGDYINMTATERRTIRKFVPFYSWFRTITRYTLSLAETNPIRTNLVNKLSMILGDENENLPEYQRGSIPTNYVSERTGKPLRLNYEHSIPFSTFGDTADNPIGMFNPLITQTLESVRGKREFMDKPFVSRNYENVFPNGYASLDPNNKGEYSNELPLSERIMSLPISIARTSIPGLDWTERVGAGTIMNLINGNGFKPYDALFDTSLGGYNYNEGFYRRPKGWDNQEQILKLLMPLQQEGKLRKRVKTKRK